jgi:enoyl-CoA hydratase
MEFSDYEAIIFRRDGHVLHATFNRPDTLNAVDERLDEELSRLFDDVAADSQTNVLVLTGVARAKHLIHSILDCPKPIIAKVNGPAMGLGATIALFCDLIIAANHAKIADPHVKVGYTAGDGGCVIWPQLIGYARAKEFLFFGDAITGEEAAKIGLINRAVPAEDLDRVVDEYAQRLAKGAARAIQWTKLSVNIGLKQLATSMLDASFAYEALSNMTKDHQEAVNAFREKRPPRFTGE